VPLECLIAVGMILALIAAVIWLNVADMRRYARISRT
jgi:hypothetical protein